MLPYIQTFCSVDKKVFSSSDTDRTSETMVPLSSTKAILFENCLFLRKKRLNVLPKCFIIKNIAWIQVTKKPLAFFFM